MNVDKLSNDEKEKLKKLLTPKLTKFIPHVPTAKQAAGLVVPHSEVFFGGAAGGGKSDWLLMGGLQYVDVDGYAGIIFRKSYADLSKPGALMDRAREWLNPFIETKEVKWVDKDKKYEFYEAYGPHRRLKSILQFGYMESYKDRLNYQGGEYQFIGFDEVTHIDKRCYTYMFSRRRKLKNVNIPTRIHAASNPPDDDGGEWVFHRFVNPETKKENVIFIPARLSDNPHVDAEDYTAALQELDPVSRARLLNGSWTVKRKGNMFKEEWFPIVSELPNRCHRIRYWDLATIKEDAKKKQKGKDPDWAVGFLLSRTGNNYVIEDIERMRGTPKQVEERVKAVAREDGFTVPIRMEEEPGSSGVIVTDYYRKVLSGYNFDGVYSNENKLERAKYASSAAEKRQIGIYRYCRNAKAFFAEAESFPGGNHDDTVDGLSGSFNYLSRLYNSDAIPIAVSAGDVSTWHSLNGNDFSDSLLNVGSYWDM